MYFFSFFNNLLSINDLLSTSLPNHIYHLALGLDMFTLDQVLVWISEWGPMTLFFLMALGIVGLPVPDECIMATVGCIVATEPERLQLGIYTIYFSALAGAISGITISYFLGYRYGYPLLQKYGRWFFFNEERLQKTQRIFNRWGPWVLPIGYFIPGVRHFTACFTGISKMKFSEFALFAYVGAAFWCSVFVGGGYLIGLYYGDIIGDLFARVHDFFTQYKWVAFLCLALIVSVIVLRKYCKKKEKLHIDC